MLRVPVGKAMQECAHKNGTGPIDCGNVSVWPGGCCEWGGELWNCTSKHDCQSKGCLLILCGLKTNTRSVCFPVVLKV